MRENTATRLKQIMRERSLKQRDILDMAKPHCENYRVKLNSSDLSQYVNGKVEPGQTKLFILARALDGAAIIIGRSISLAICSTPPRKSAANISARVMRCM